MYTLLFFAYFVGVFQVFFVVVCFEGCLFVFVSDENCINMFVFVSDENCINMYPKSSTCLQYIYAY